MSAAALSSGAAAEPWRSIRAAAVDRYRRDAADRFGWRFARGKLGIDPVFRHLLETGLLEPGSRVLDLGCGQGLVGALVAAAEDAAQRGRWPDGWPAAPVGTRFVGIELMPRDAARARLATGAAVVCGDLRDTAFPPADTVLLLDVLHYLAPAEQDRVLERARDTLAPRGRLLLRVGDAGEARAFRLGAWVDRIVAVFRRRRAVRVHGRPLAAWTARLAELGFAVEARPMSRGTPFANVLLVATWTPPR